MDANLKNFEEWISCQEHLPKNYDKQMLRFFLRGCKHDLREAKRRFEMYYATKSTMPDLFNNRKSIFSKENKRFLDNSYAIVLPHLTNEGFRISCVGIYNDNIEDFNMDMFARICVMFADFRMSHDTNVAGDVFVINAAHARPIHATKFLSRFMVILLGLVQNTFPFRLRQIHVVNVPNYIDKLISMIKMILSEKLRDRLCVHRGVDTILDHIPKRCLPAEFGGTLCSMSEMDKRWKRLFEDNLDWFAKQEQVICQVPIPKNLTDRLMVSEERMEGTFRLLEID